MPQRTIICFDEKCGLNDLSPGMVYIYIYIMMIKIDGNDEEN